MRRQTFLLQLFVDGDRLPLRPNHAYVARWSLHRPAQHSHIVAVSAGDDHDIRRLAGREPRRSFVEIFRDHLLCLGKALAVRVGFAIIDHGDVESRDARDLVKAFCYMACTKNIEDCWWQDWLHKDLERSSADEASVVLWIMIQVERQGPRLLRFHHFVRRLPHFGFHATAADGADD